MEAAAASDNMQKLFKLMSDTSRRRAVNVGQWNDMMETEGLHVGYNKSLVIELDISRSSLAGPMLVYLKWHPRLQITERNRLTSWRTWK